MRGLQGLPMWGQSLPLGALHVDTEHEGATSDSWRQQIHPCRCSFAHSSGMNWLVIYFSLFGPRRHEFTDLRPRFPSLFPLSQVWDALIILVTWKAKLNRVRLLSLAGVQKLELTRADLLFQNLLYCVLWNKTKILILMTAPALTSAASKDGILLSIITGFPMSLRQGLTFTTGYRTGPENETLPNSFLFSYFFKDLKTKYSILLELQKWFLSKLFVECNIHQEKYAYH